MRANVFSKSPLTSQAAHNCSCCGLLFRVRVALCLLQCIPWRWSLAWARMGFSAGLSAFFGFPSTSVSLLVIAEHAGLLRHIRESRLIPCPRFSDCYTLQTNELARSILANAFGSR